MAIVTLFADEKVIETKIIPNNHLKIEGYLQGLQTDMLERNEALLKCTVRAEFRVEVIPRKIIRN